MRATFVKTLVELAEQDRRIVLLTGDLGFMALEPFAENFPERFFNVGVAEQNMVGVATGLAEAGFIPFVYSIATFAVLRTYEFIRNGPILHRLPVRIVGVGGGFDYGQNGITHYGLEDVGLMRVQPGITVIVPADPPQARNALRATWNLPGPVYYRLGKNEKDILTSLDGDFALGRARLIAPGGDILVITMGSVALEAARAVEILAGKSVKASLMVVASANPAPIGDLKAALASVRLAVTVEAHYVTGGLGSMVSEVVAEHGLGCAVVRLGVREPFDGVSGSTSYLYGRHGISAAAIAEVVLSRVRVSDT